MFRGNGYQHADVVRYDMSFDYFVFLLPGQGVEYGAKGLSDLPEQYLSSPLRNKYYVVFAIPFGMG